MKIKELSKKEFLKVQSNALKQSFSPFAIFMNEMQGFTAVNKQNKEIPKYILFWSWKLKTKKAVKNNIFLQLKNRTYE